MARLPRGRWCAAASYRGSGGAEEGEGPAPFEQADGDGDDETKAGHDEHAEGGYGQHAVEPPHVTAVAVIGADTGRDLSAGHPLAYQGADPLERGVEVADLDGTASGRYEVGPVRCHDHRCVPAGHGRQPSRGDDLEAVPDPDACRVLPVLHVTRVDQCRAGHARQVAHVAQQPGGGRWGGTVDRGLGGAVLLAGDTGVAQRLSGGAVGAGGKADGHWLLSFVRSGSGGRRGWRARRCGWRSGPASTVCRCGSGATGSASHPSSSSAPRSVAW